MTESQKMLWGGIALMIFGLGLILFGGNRESGEYIELFGLRFGRGKSEPMSRGESLFWGTALLGGGAVLIKYSGVFG